MTQIGKQPIEIKELKKEHFRYTRGSQQGFPWREMNVWDYVVFSEKYSREAVQLAGGYVQAFKQKKRKKRSIEDLRFVARKIDDRVLIIRVPKSAL